VWVILVLLVLLLAIGAATAATPPRAPQLLSQVQGIPEYHHTGWRVGQGAPGDIWDIAQDHQGTLWLATGAGLYRFDGHRFERRDAPAGSSFASTNMVTLHVDDDDSLWIGHFNAGISHLDDAALRGYAAAEGVPEGVVPRFARTADGRLWAAINGGLRWFDGRRWQPPPATMGVPTRRVQWLFQDSRGTLWVCAGLELWQMPRGATRLQPIGLQVSQMATVAEDRHGMIWLADRLRGTLPVADARGVLAADEREARRLPGLLASRLLFARDGAMWGTHSPSGGVFRVTFRDGRPWRREDFDTPQGLTATSAVPIFEDREGNIWVGTNLGLNRFRAHSVGTLHQGPSDPYRVLVRGSDGQVFGYGEDLQPYALQRGMLDADAAALRRAGSRATTPLWQFDWERIWLRQGDRRVPVALPDGVAGQPMHALHFPGDAEAWACLGSRVVLHYLDRRWQTVPGLPEQACSVLAAGGAGQLWLGYRDGTLRLLQADGVTVFGPAEGLAVGPVTAVFARGGEVIVAGENGLAVQTEAGRFLPVHADLPGIFEGVTGIVADAGGQRWFNGSRGLVRMAATTLHAAARAGQVTQPRLFDDVDGMPGIALQSGPVPTAMLAPDGMLWLATNQGLAWLDTAAVASAPAAPPVEVTRISHGNREAAMTGQPRLPAGTTQLQLDYVARALSRPERVRYRYRLSGVDSNWQQVGGATRAHYTNLGPGQYRFEVVAANEDGLWGSTPTVAHFEILPTFMQTLWFKLLCVTCALVLLAMAVRLRSQRLAALVRARLQERHGERERIARELHDTLLQGSQGLILRLHAISQAPPTPADVRHQLEAAMQVAERNLAEGRERVAALRDGPRAGHDLATALAEVHEEFAGRGTNPMRLTVEGVAPPLLASAADEVFLLGREAIRNALHHADASAIEVELAYGTGSLMLHVRDNGRGMPEGGPVTEGHWGLQGMQERATRLGGELRMWSRIGLGTEIALSVPARRIYRRRPPWWRRLLPAGKMDP